MRFLAVRASALLVLLLLALPPFVSPPALSAQAARSGADVYATTCTACHLGNGAGISGVFPPLVGSDLVTGRLEWPIAIVLRGLQGEITVDGESYNGLMTPWATLLSDEEIANVVTYIRSQFGNRASAASAEQVKAVRDATADQLQGFTVAELRERYP